MVTVVAFLPVTWRIDLHQGQRRLVRITVSFGRWQRFWQPNAEGQQPPNASPTFGQRFLQQLRYEKRTRRFLRRHTVAEKLDVQLLVHTGNAAATAMLTGGAWALAESRVLLTFLPAHWRPALRLQVLPDFLREHTTLNARCIFRVRLGILIITACRVLIALTLRHVHTAREASTIWSTPSEN